MRGKCVVLLPEHGRCLSMAASELGILAQQCLDRRLAGRAAVEQEVAAWEARRTAATRTIDRRFTTAAARIKLKRLYPVIHEC